MGKKREKTSLSQQVKSKNYSVMAAVTGNKVLGCQITKGGVKQGDFAGFFCTLFQEKNVGNRNTNLVIFIDGASTHHSKFVKSTFESKITFLFNAGYSPMLNPIGEFFSKFK